MLRLDASPLPWRGMTMDQICASRHKTQMGLRMCGRWARTRAGLAATMPVTRGGTLLVAKLGARVPLTEADRRVLAKCGLRIRKRLAEVSSIAKPETLLA